MAQSDNVVVVLDDHDFRGRSIALVIESSAIDATCHYHDIGDGIHVDRLREIAGNRPGVVLAVIAVGGTSLQDEGVLAAVAAVRSAAPTARVAMLCDDTSAGAVEFAVEAEIDGIVPTYLPEQVATAALQFILAGGYYFPHAKHCRQEASAAPAYRELSAEVEALRTPSGDCAETAPARVAANEPELTSRQADVLDALCRGCSNKVIARMLDISEATVKIHVRQLLRKFDATNRTQIVIRSAGRIPDRAQAV